MFHHKHRQGLRHEVNSFWSVIRFCFYFRGWVIHPQISLIFSPHSWSIVNFHFIDWLLLLWSDQSPLLPRQPRPLQRSRTPRVRLVTKVENRSLGLWWPAICKRLIPSTAARRRARRRIGIPPSFSPSLFFIPLFFVIPPSFLSLPSQFILD